MNIHTPSSSTVLVIDPLQDALELLQQAGFSTDIEYARQVYVNRDLRMSRIAWVGFDMDYTLARYHQDELDALSVKHTVDTLVEKFGYPEKIRSIEPDPDFAIRGLVIDRHEGNILKMDSHHYVGRAFHGFKALSQEKRRAYNDERVRIDSDRYKLVDTLFALPETFLYTAIIDCLEGDSESEQTVDYPRLYDDVRAAIDLAHADGRIKREILTDLSRYVVRDRELAPTLHKFRSAGKRLFLLTNSELYYTDEVMKYLMEGTDPSYPTWEHFFDVIITSSRKPVFFQSDDPFLVLGPDGEPVGEEREHFERGRVYAGGNQDDFAKMLNFRGSDVLYVGDHIYGDIVRSKRDSAWRTAMLIQEMEAELKKRDTMRQDLDLWSELDRYVASLNSDLAARRRVLDRLDEMYTNDRDNDHVVRAKRELKASIDRLNKLRREALGRLIDLDDEVSRNFNPYWGFLFKEGAEHSIFGGQVEEYACTYTSRVSNFRFYSPMRYFRARHQRMPHEG